MPRAAIYARFSTDRQSESSAEDQVRICRERAEREGWEIVDVYADLAISGTSNTRPGLNGLLASARAGQIDILLAEAIDRISRNQADIATIYQQLEFIGVKIITLSEGEINELHIGLKGTMNALFLKDLGDKIRRGQRGRVETGNVPGGLCYGYAVKTGLDAQGELIRGARTIDEAQAEVVRRIYREFLAGISPRMIAHRLNADGIKSARGGEWRASAIVGSRARQIGVLHNPIYSGRLVFNRVKMVRDPTSRKRVSRINPPSEWITREFPDLRIVDEASWLAVQNWRDSNSSAAPGRQVRPKHLLSGLVLCGECGGSYTIVNRDKWGCVRRKDAGTCSNARRISTDRLESRILAGLKHSLLSPDAISLAVREYHDERTRLREERLGSRANSVAKLAKAEEAISRLVNAIAEGANDFAEIREALAARRHERDRAKAELAEHDAVPVITLHPHVADAYRRKVDALGRTLTTGDQARQAILPALRSLIEKIVLHPDDTALEGVSIEVTGSLDNVLRLATGNTTVPVGNRTMAVVAKDRYSFDRSVRTLRV